MRLYGSYVESGSQKKPGCVDGFSCSLERAQAAGKVTKGDNKSVETVCKPKYSTLSLVGSSRPRGSSDNADVYCNITAAVLDFTTENM